MTHKLVKVIPLFFISLFSLSCSLFFRMLTRILLYPFTVSSPTATLESPLHTLEHSLFNVSRSCVGWLGIIANIPFKPFPVSHGLQKPRIVASRILQFKFLRWTLHIILDIPFHSKESIDSITVNITADETPVTSDTASTDDSTKLNVFLETSSGSFVDVPITPPTSSTDVLSLFAFAILPATPASPVDPARPFLSLPTPYSPVTSEGSTLVNEDSEEKVKRLLASSTPKRRQPLAEIAIPRTKSRKTLGVNTDSLLKAPECKIQTSSSTGKENQPPSKGLNQKFQTKGTSYKKDTFMTSLKMDLIPIGEGGFGQVFRATASEDRNIAVKLMKRGTITQEIAIANEVQALKVAKGCRWAVELIYFQAAPEQALIALTYLPGGDMHSYWERSSFCLDFPTAQFYVAQLILAIHDLHSRGIIHRDIKLENMMLDSQRNLKLVDFGLAQVFNHETVCQEDFPFFHQLRKLGGDSFPLLWATSHNPHQTDLANGTEGYAPPEVWRCESHSFGVDYFAMGCVLHMLITGNAPFEFNQTAQDYKYDKISVDNSMHVDAYDFLVKVLAPRPMNRLNVQRMKSHPVFRGIDWNALATGTIKAPPYPCGH